MEGLQPLHRRVENRIFKRPFLLSRTISLRWRVVKHACAG